jgi:hypothetical protein
VASAVAGLIVVQTADGRLAHYNGLGFVVMGAMLTTVALMYPIHRAVKAKMANEAQAQRAQMGGPTAAAQSGAASGSVSQLDRDVGSPSSSRPAP